MKKASSANRILLVLTVFFMLVAAVSFAAFQQSALPCPDSTACARPEAPSIRGGDMLWDAFTQRFLSLLVF